MPLSRRPAAADAHTSPAGHAPDTVPPWKSDLHGHRSHPAKDSRPSPGPARQDRSARSCHGPLADPIPAKREAAPGHRGQLARHYMPGHPRSDLPASLMAAIDLRDTPQVPAIDLPQTRAASGRGPVPTTPPAHPILPNRGRCLNACLCPGWHGRSQPCERPEATITDGRCRYGLSGRHILSAGYCHMLAVPAGWLRLTFPAAASKATAPGLRA